MTEAEWVACGSPAAMFVQIGGTALDRKRRLLGCGLGRHMWPALRDARSRAAVEVAERYADAAATEDQLAEAEAGARAVMLKMRKYNRSRSRYECLGTAVPVWASGSGVRGWGVGDTSEGDPAGGPAADAAIWEDAAEAMSREGGEWHGELRWLCGTVRCVFGNPFQPVTFGRNWRKKSVTEVAQAIYDERAFDRMPALADALEAVGCEDAEVLAHCRSGGPHVRGCWVVDGVLGKS